MTPAEVDRIVQRAAAAAPAWARAERGRILPGLPLAEAGRVPRGVVVVILPAVHGARLMRARAGRALALGNAVVVRPSRRSVAACRRVAEAWWAAGVPPEVLALAPGAGESLVSHPMVDAVAFTGSTAVGVQVARVADLVPVHLEMGGKDAAVVLPGADLEAAARCILASAMGRACPRFERVVAVGGAARVVHGLARLARERRSWPRGTALGRDLLEEALSLGAVARFRSGDAAVLEGVTAGMGLAWEEVLSPIVPVLAVDEVAEAVAVVNRSRYGRQASVFGPGGREVAEVLEVARVDLDAGPPPAPICGWKDSGLDGGALLTRSRQVAGRGA